MKNPGGTALLYSELETTVSPPACELEGVFTVDVEDYYQVTAFEHCVSRSEWDSYPSRVVNSTRRLLDLLARYDIRATFYVLGWVAEKSPDLVKAIHAAGHEIGSHSYWHRRVYQQSPDEFREDLRRSCGVLSAITNEKVTTYRAPSFSITSKSRWALEILVEQGITVDSSIFPIVHDRYGIAGAARHIHQLETASGPIWEFPPTVARFGMFNVPTGGGGYFRLYPWAVTKNLLARFRKQLRNPFMFYIHPWEVDPDQPVLQSGSRLTQYRHYVNLRDTEQKLGRLFDHFRLGTVGEGMSPIVSAASTANSNAA